MAAEETPEDVIDASPTKELFIKILTVDINLEDGILDLLDNSVDGYIRNEIKERREIKIDISPERFVISDTCGGINYDFLKNHAFRFGVEELSRAHATLGVYGIGLKRSIFKIGNDMAMETDDGKTYSKVVLNVEKWRVSDRWTIPFDTSDSRLGDDEKPYTKIEITTLHDDIAAKFALVSFINDLDDAISKTYSKIIEEKVDIYLNNKIVDPYSLDFTFSELYTPSRATETREGVTIDITCGVSPRKSRAEEFERRGWNVFFNDRLILRDDRTAVTGWSGEKEELPQFHQRYNEFTGVVFLTSEDPSKLPLNTRKNGFNTDTKIYQEILDLMIRQAKDVVKYLNEKYKDQGEKLEEIEEEVNETVEEDTETHEKVPLGQIAVGTTFKARHWTRQREEFANIQYKKPKTLVELVKKHIKAGSWKNAGEKTFDYYVEMEEIEYE